MIILSIESCFESTSVCIGTEEGIIDWMEIKDKNRAGKLLVCKIKELFGRNRLPYNNVDIIFVDLGPGSYTGVRIGGIVAKTMSVTLNKRYYGISSLELIASTFLQSAQMDNVEDKTLISVLDAKSDFLYRGIFNVKNEKIIEIKTPDLVSVDEFIKNIENSQNWLIISCNNDIINKLQTLYRIQPEKLYAIHTPTAKELLKLGVKKLRSNNNFIYEPLYLRRSYAEEKFNVFV